MTRHIPVEPHHNAIVDDEDYEELSRFAWNAVESRSTIYARVSSHRGGASYMHSKITGFEETDHRNGNGLDNRRENLREVTGSMNNANGRKRKTHKRKPTTSPFKGVYWDSPTSKWAASAKIDGKRHWLGRFSNEIEAAKAYDAKALELFGEFARINFASERDA